MTPKLDLESIQKRADAATPGPWFNCSETVIISLDRPGIPENSNGIIAECDDPFKPDRHSNQRGINADFIAGAREDIPILVEAIKDLAEELRKIADAYTMVGEISRFTKADMVAIAERVLEKWNL